MAEESESTKEKGKELMPDIDKKVILAAFGLLLLVAAGAYYMNMQPATPAESNATSENDPVEETNRSVGLSPSDIEGEISDVNITDVKAEPASIRIAPEDGVRFVNQAGIDVQFSFDRDLPNYNLSAEDSIIVDPTSITYYEVTPQEEGEDFRDISARINVQG